MPTRVSLTPQVRDDIVEGALYIANDNPDAAERFLTAVEQTFDTIAHSPLAGVARSFTNPHLEGVRMFPVSGFQNYLVFYRPTDAAIEIIRVLHAARDIRRLFE